MRGIVIVGAVLLAIGTAVSAQSPGSIESELKYAREYMEAGKWDYAMWRYEAILQRDPDNAEARAGYARAKAAHEGGDSKAVAREQLVPQPRNDAGQAAQTLKVGDRVEFDRFSDGTWGRFGRITKVNSGANPPCPSYFVEEEGGGITLSYVCTRVRPAGGAAAPAPDQRAGAKGAPPVGSYFCTYGLNRGQVLGPGRNFRLLPGGAYAADDGARGTYRYDAASGKIIFKGGFFGRMAATGEYKGGRSQQIDIDTPGGLVTFCSKQ
jgi:hypothetical protein